MWEGHRVRLWAGEGKGRGGSQVGRRVDGHRAALGSREGVDGESVGL